MPADTIRFATNARNGGEAIASYAALLNERLVRGLQIEQERLACFEGRFRQFSHGPFRVSDVAHSGHVGRMGPDRRPDAPLFILYHRDGEYRARSPDRSSGAQPLLLKPGDIVICQHYGDVEMEACDGRIRQTSIMFDLDYAAAVAPQLIGEARRLNARQGVGRLIATHLLTLSKGSDELSRTVIAQVAESCLQLAGAAFPNVRGYAADRPASRRLSDIQNYMLQNLADPDLSPDGIADVFALSRRTLDRLFREAEAPAATWLKLRRLEAARTALGNPVQRDRSITEIVYSCGFTHPAHFSRAFTSAYKMSPSEFRRRRRAGAGD